jgi:DNA-binding NarL/FixJ family response regulator
VRVIVAEDVGLYRDMLVETLAGAALEVTGQAGSADDVVALVDADPPDVVLLDIRMPPTYTDDGVRAAVRIRARHPEVAVVILSQHGEAEYAVELVRELERGVGYVLKERMAGARELLDVIRRVAAGGVVIDPDVVTRLIRRPRVDDPLAELTEREREALALMAEGHSNAAIARRMGIAVSTVEKHASSVFHKLATNLDAADLAGDNARVRAVLTYLQHTGRIAGPERGG